MCVEGALMRNFLIAAASAVALASSGHAATRNFGITSFDKIRVEGPFRVTLTTGVAPFAKATGSPAAIDRVAIEVRGNTLVVHNNLDSWGGDPHKDPGPVEISLGTHDLSVASLNGSGLLAIDHAKGLMFGLSVQGSGAAAIGKVEVDQLSVSVGGSASARLAGKAGKITLIARGISSVDAANLVAKDATIGAEGAATIDASVSDAATVDVNGPATVRFTGGPSCTLRVSGSASVSGCR
jgi:hypothetical protein